MRVERSKADHRLAFWEESFHCNGIADEDGSLKILLTPVRASTKVGNLE